MSLSGRRPQWRSPAARPQAAHAACAGSQVVRSVAGREACLRLARRGMEALRNCGMTHAADRFVSAARPSGPYGPGEVVQCVEAAIATDAHLYQHLGGLDAVSLDREAGSFEPMQANILPPTFQASCPPPQGSDNRRLGRSGMALIVSRLIVASRPHYRKLATTPKGEGDRPCAFWQSSEYEREKEPTMRARFAHYRTNFDVVLKKHARRRMKQHDVQLLQIRTVLRTGVIVRVESDIRTGHDKYRVSGHDADGRALEVVANLDETGSGRVVIVTVIDRD